MSIVYIKKDGLYISNKRIKKKRVLRYLRDHIVLAEDVTLGDIFKIVSHYKALKFFISQYSWCNPLDFLLSQALLPYEQKEEKLDYLEVYWHVYYLSDRQITKKTVKLGRFDISCAFHAISMPADKAELDIDNPHNLKAGQVTPYSVSLSPMNELAHLRIKLNDEIKIFDSNKKYDPIIVTRKCYALIDFLDAIFWDLSYYGVQDYT